MRITINNAKSWTTYTFGVVAAISAAYVGIYSFIYPRTEADASIARISKRIDSVEDSQKTDRKALKDINGIYQILLNRK